MHLSKLYGRQERSAPDSAKDDSHQNLWSRQRANHAPPARGFGFEQVGAQNKRLGNRGFTILGPILVLAICFVGAGLLEVKRSIELRTQRQTQLDRDSGSPPLQLRAALKTLQASYQRLDIYRALTLAACPIVPTPACPEAMAGFKLASRVERMIQIGVRTFWQLQVAMWETHSGAKSSFPSFEFRIAQGNESDLLVSWQTEFDGKTARPLCFSIQKWGLAAKSELRRDDHEWTVAWTQ